MWGLGREGRQGKVAQRERKWAVEADLPHALSPPGNRFPEWVSPVLFRPQIPLGSRAAG